jgi:hypothetical protein
MTNVVFTVCFVLVLALAGQGQTDRAWTALEKKDAEKLVTNSPWARTQTDTDVSELFYSPTKEGSSAIARTSTLSTGRVNDQRSINNSRADQGAKNEAINVNYHIRLFSARPVREAIARLILIDQGPRFKEISSLMQPLVERDFGPFVVITVVADSNDGRALGPVIQAMSKATADLLRNKTYLERKDGKRLFLLDYRPPQADGLGAKFVFERAPEGKPFINEDAGNFRFYSEMTDTIKLNVKYNVADLVYRGKLEF